MKKGWGSAPGPAGASGPGPRYLAAFVLALLPASAHALTIDIPGQPDGSTATTHEAACGGHNTSPALTWRGVPANAQSLALTIFDPDAQHGAGYVHWVLYGLPPTLSGLPENAGARIPPGATPGINSPGSGHYFGMCPPVGDPPHHYIFHLYALDLARAALRPGLPEPALRAAIAGHILADAKVTLLYARR